MGTDRVDQIFAEEAERRLRDDFEHSHLKQIRDFIGPLFEHLRFW